MLLFSPLQDFHLFTLALCVEGFRRRGEVQITIGLTGYQYLDVSNGLSPPKVRQLVVDGRVIRSNDLRCDLSAIK